MSKTDSTPLTEEFKARGLIKQVTDNAIEKALEEKPQVFYIGFDPTSDSLHIGSLLPVLTMRRLQKAGHKPIALVGGATGMIGDPSGKTQERNLLNSEILDRNLLGIQKTLSRFLDSSGANAVKVVNNASWFEKFSYLDFLREVGKHFTVNHMVAKESVRARLEDREQGISYTEFSYMLLQAYDFYILNKQENCTIQVGGSDQWGNITAGCELIRRMSAAKNEKAKPAFGMTHPLVLKSDGTKFGKTEEGTIWLDPEKTTPYRFYQFLLQTSDEDVIRFLKYFSFRDLSEINELEEAMKKAPEKREAQKALAAELTELIHGSDELTASKRASESLFGGSLKDLDKKTLLDIFSDAPSTEQPKTRLSEGLLLIDLLVHTQLCKSKGAARKDVTAGGIYVNNERVTDAQTKISTQDLVDGQFLVLRKGKKNFHLVSFI